MAEWQTRRSQKPLIERSWRFDSSRSHHGVNTDMKRREAVKLLALAPVALHFKPSKPEPYEIRCFDCGDLVARVKGPTKVKRKGLAYCGAHANQENGYGLITKYCFGVYTPV